MAAIVVYHSSFGCGTGCCGHRVESGNLSKFEFDHPNGEESDLEFAKRMVEELVGPEHVVDLDWANCVIVDD